MDYQTCNIVYKDCEGWECIEACIVASPRFWHLLSIGGEIIPGFE